MLRGYPTSLPRGELTYGAMPGELCGYHPSGMAPAFAASVSTNPAKRAVERWWLMFTPVWGVVCGVIMVSGLAERWGDAELMTLGVAMALLAVVPPVLRPVGADVGEPIQRRTSFKMGVSVVLVSFLMNYFCTPYFFDVLHMHFGFNTRINIQNNPLFLYFMTVAYFATYAALINAGFRLSRSRLRGPLRAVGMAFVPFLVAGLETALNANPFMRSLFCFDDLGFMLWFGTLSYGACFLFTMPVWTRIDETADERVPLSQVVIWTLAAVLMIVVTFEVLRHHVAPHVTIVETGAQSLRDFDSGSCLAPIRD